MRVSVSDVGSNFEENLQKWARALGTGEVKRKIFLKIYSNRKKNWSVVEIAEATGLTAKVVASAGRQMCVGGLFEQLDGGRVVYQKISEVHHSKARIIKNADNKKARESLPTKRSSTKGGISHMAKITNKFVNVGVVNTGKMSGSITGNSQHIQHNEEAKKLITAFKQFKTGILQDASLSTEQKEDAISAATDLETEVAKPEQNRSMSRIRNAVGALKMLASGAGAVHQLYEQIHPLVASHFHLPS